MASDLLAAVLAAPDDDGPRLVYADWLDEHGDLTRAEFIRLQIAIPHFPRRTPGVYDRDEMAALSREKLLLHNFGPHWLGPLRAPSEPLEGKTTHAQFSRGFVESVWIRASTFLNRGTRLTNLVPLRELHITRLRENDFEELTRFPPCRFLHTVDLAGKPLNRMERSFSRYGSVFASLRRVLLPNCGLGDAQARFLASNPWGWNLTELDIRYNPISDRALDLLYDRYGSALKSQRQL
jgi:uncharacterized protein (TIGR02996 family)